MSIESSEVNVQVIRDVESVSLLDAARVAIVTELAQRKVDDSGLSISVVLYNQMVVVYKDVSAKFKKAGEEVNNTAIRLKFEESLVEAEDFIRADESLDGKIPRCWVNAKSVLTGFLDLGGDPNKHGTVSSIKAWNSQEKKRVKEEEGRKALASIAKSGEHVKDTGVDGKKSPAEVTKSEVTTTDVKVSPLAASASELDDRVLELITQITQNAQSIHPDKAIKMLTGLNNQFAAIVGAAVKSVVNG